MGLTHASSVIGVEMLIDAELFTPTLSFTPSKLTALLAASLGSRLAAPSVGPLR